MKDSDYSVLNFSVLIRASVCAVVTCVSIHSSSFAAEVGYITPLTEFGVPDFQGTWSLATQTNLERAQRFEGKLVISEEEALLIEGDLYTLFRALAIYKLN